MKNDANFTPLSKVFLQSNSSLTPGSKSNWIVTGIALVVALLIVGSTVAVMQKFVFDQKSNAKTTITTSTKAKEISVNSPKSCLLPPKVSSLRFDCASSKAVCSWDLQGSGVLYSTKVVGRYEGVDYLVSPSRLSAANRIDFEAKTGFEYECSVASSVSCGNSEETKVRGVCKDAYTAGVSPVPVTPSIEMSPTTTPLQDVDLYLTASDQSDPIALGNTINYTITAKNLGKDTAKNVVISSFLPSTTSYVSANITRGKCTHSQGLLTCLVDEMMGNDSVILTLSVVASNAGQYTSYNMIKSDSSELINANNTASQETTISPSVDLVISGVKASDPVGFGQNQTITYLVSNYGPSSATGAAFNLNIPSGMNFVSAGANTGTCSNSSTSVNCSLGTIPKYGVSKISVVLVPTQIGTLNYSATATSSVNEKDSANNTLVLSTTSQAISPSQVDMSVFLTDASDPIRSGDSETYTASVKNNSAQTATNVAVNIAISTIMTYTSAFSTLGSCTIIPSTNGSGGVLSCVLGTMTSNQVATITLTTRAGFNGEGMLFATVSSSETDSQLSNNFDDEATLITPQNDLSLTVDSANVVVNTQKSTDIDFVLSNLGPTDASNVTLRVNLPGNFVSESIYSTYGSCPESGGVVTCTVGNLIKNQIVRLRVGGRFLDIGSYQMRGEVLSSENEQLLSNNSALVNVTVSGPVPTVAASTGTSENFDESSDSARLLPTGGSNLPLAQSSQNTVLGSFENTSVNTATPTQSVDTTSNKKFPVWAMFLLLFGVVGMAVML